MGYFQQRRFIFHYIAMPHLPVTREYCACAFTQKVRNLSRMLLDGGHRVIVYGVDHSDIDHPEFEFVPVVTLDDVRDQWGDGDNRFELGYDWKASEFRHDLNSQLTLCSAKFIANARAEISKRKEDDHFLLLSQGLYYKPVADALGMYLTCEPGVGYRGSYCKFRVFESAYIQNFTYGSEHPRQSINGNYYDRVIPNYLDPNDFSFGKEPGKYLAYLGRLIPRKGVSTAMKIADHLDMQLLLAGQGSLLDVGYSTPRAKHVGVLGVEERKEFLRSASVGLVPTVYLEPFGTVSIEFMLSGTPVVTTNFGVFPETIQDGVCGYRCDTLQDFVVRTAKATELDREKVRDYAMRFTMPQVSKLYEKWFSELYQLYMSSVDGSVLAWHWLP